MSDDLNDILSEMLRLQYNMSDEEISEFIKRDEIDDLIKNGPNSTISSNRKREKQSKRVV